MFCEHETYANFASVDHFATIIAKPELVLVITHDPCQNARVKSQRVHFSADLAQGFSPAKYSSNTVPPTCTRHYTHLIRPSLVAQGVDIERYEESVEEVVH